MLQVVLRPPKRRRPARVRIPNRPFSLVLEESGTRDSNSRHPAWEAGTLPTELVPQSMAFVTPQPARVNDSPAAQASRPVVGDRDKKRNGPGLSTWAAPVSAPSGALLASVASALRSWARQPARLRPDVFRGACAHRHVLASDDRARLRRLLRMRAIGILHLLFPPPAYRHPRAQRSRPPPRADVSLGVFR